MSSDKPRNDKSRVEQREERAQEVREGFRDALVQMVKTSQRLTDLAENSGVDFGLLEGAGDTIYEALTMQLLVAERVMRRNQRMTENVLSRLERRVHDDNGSQALLFKADETSPLRREFRVRNNTSRTGALSFRTRIRSNGYEWFDERHEPTDVGKPFGIEPGRYELAPGDETLVELAISVKALAPNAKDDEVKVAAANANTWLGEIEVALGDRRTLTQDFEIRRPVDVPEKGKQARFLVVNPLDYPAKVVLSLHGKNDEDAYELFRLRADEEKLEPNANDIVVLEANETLSECVLKVEVVGATIPQLIRLKASS